MDAPAADMELEHKKIETEEKSPAYPCGLCDTEVVHKIAQMLLPGLATACVDSTTGDIFRTAASVAVDMRKELIEYLTQRSETFVADTVILEEHPAEEVSDHPYDIISDFVEDFATLKRNLWGRVSGWLLSERREDRIDDIVQEMELTKFWLIDRRQALAQTLLKNVDLKNTFHCDMKFNTAEELENHAPQCRFRSMICDNEGCNAIFIADHMEKHDMTCPFKIIPCEQKCPSDGIMRRDMDRHCLTVCPMKLVNCPFYQVGCQSTIPQCAMDEHISDSLHDHLLHVLQSTRRETSADKLKALMEQLEKSPFSSQLAAARDPRSLISAVKAVEAKLEPSEMEVVNSSFGEQAPTSSSASPSAEDYHGQNGDVN
ncbi:uncharacterized protein LOC116208336 [Punica granatum]|uniref:Uncharacterized protein LOC116208336 n=2 Tax=Punica granatum TaxID=22663 RepID=A0A6P8DYW6_PUNGR|nr:uncharacterized protein LOC116208336 [Punica granatum]XP_031397574.1 uncharacterized protein LOC116208336 [Punica granatum]PKI32811.1 hypothetical protein CRG98_046804 [Punica granatum]